MKKYILILITVFYVHATYSFTPGEHPDLKELLKAAGKNTYIKDFAFKLKPGEETQFIIELEKRTIYEWFANMKDYKQFRLTLFNNYGYTIYSTKDETVGIFNFSTKSNKEQKYILNVKNTSDKAISSTILLSTAKKLEQHETIVQNPKLEKLLNVSKDTYLKDFTNKIEPHKDARYSVVLSKNNTYSLSVFQNTPGQFELQLIESKSEKRLKPKSININNEISYNLFDISNTAVYHIIVKNNSSVTSESVVLLSFVDKFYRTEPEEEVITPTSQEENKDLNQNNAEEIYFVVDDMPKFIGEIKDFKKYLNNNINYPQEALTKGIKGTVYVQFTVAKNGYIKDAKVARGVHPSLDQEALRLVYSSPKWKPGKKDGEPADVVLTFPIIFKLP